MEMLIAGVALWSLAHFIPTLGQGLKQALVARIGAQPYRGVVALLVMSSLGLIYMGWTTTDPVGVYEPPGWAVHANNTLMLVAVYLLVSSHITTRVRHWVRHPMLLGMTLWGIAHLLANGDQRSLAVFGGLTIWAVADIFLINARDGISDGARDVKSVKSGLKNEAFAIVATLVGVGVIGFLHNLAGVSPFPSI
ncbi:MAG: NnrU family protein [Magnetovibrio sp.]|nr:NnrU family protein [Magnetovibrio sp.]